MSTAPSPPPPAPLDDGLVLRRIEPGRNMARFYVLALEPTLFGDVAVIRSWGRIGTNGRRATFYLGSAEVARAALAQQVERKRSRGYVTA